MAQLSKSYTNPAEVLFNSTELGTPKDLNELQNLVRRNLGFLLDAALSGGAQLRAFGDALKVTADGATMDLTVTGLAPILWRLAADPGAPDPQVLLHQLGADDTFTADAADGSNPRIDVFSAKVEDADVGDSESRIVKDGTTGAITSQSINKRTRTKLTVTYTPGTAAASPVAPSPPAGEVVFAEVLVDTGVSLLEQGDVTDLRSKHGRHTVIIPAVTGETGAGQSGSGGSGAGFNAGGTGAFSHPRWFNSGGGTEFVSIPIAIPAGSVIERVVVHGRSGNAAGETFSATLMEVDLATFAASDVGGGTKTSGAVDNVDSVAMEGLTVPVLATSMYHVFVSLDDGAAAAQDEVQVRAVEVTYSSS
jgi:hypothetical protein